VFCVNPSCHTEVRELDVPTCPECGLGLLLSDRFELVRPIRVFNPTMPISIFVGHDRRTQKACVIKVLDYPTPELLLHFEREAAVLGNLRHSGLPVVDIDDEGYFTVMTPSKQYPIVHCLVMEKIEGTDLSQLIQSQGKISQHQAIEWLRQLTEILQVLHHQGLFHRDIKPANVMLKPDGKLVLIDFGAVREVTQTYLCKLGRGPDPVTQVNPITIITSAAYTPYEQTQGKAVLQSDFYAMGRTFVHLLTGKSPLDFATPSTELQWRSTAPQVSKPLADFLDRLMAFSPVDRPIDTQAILATLERLPGQIKRDRRWKSPWMKTVGLGLGTIALLGLLKGTSGYVAQHYLSMGLQAAVVGKLDVAKSNLESAIFYDQDNTILHSNLAAICQQQATEAGEQCAVRHYQQALKLNPTNQAETRYNLGNLYEQLGTVDKSKEQYRIVLRDTPNFTAARNNLARLLILEGADREAEKLIQPGLSQSQDVLDRSILLKNLGWLQYQEKQYPQAAKSLLTAIQLNSVERTDAQCLLAQVYDMAPKLGTAAPFWQSCLSGNAITPEVKLWQDQKLQQLFQLDAQVRLKH
jgi:tetratricopeptide (TPR) repeat protein